MASRNFSTGSRRDVADNKAPLTRLPYKALGEVAFIHQHGDGLYGIHNWRKGQPLSELLNSASRHIAAVVTGEDIDPKSKRYHLAHAAWNVLVALNQTIHSKHYAKLDDRVNEFGDWVSKEFAKTDTAKELERGSDGE
jgi:hypothetical protein